MGLDFKRNIVNDTKGLGSMTGGVNHLATGLA